MAKMLTILILTAAALVCADMAFQMVPDARACDVAMALELQMEVP